MISCKELVSYIQEIMQDISNLQMKEYNSIRCFILTIKGFKKIIKTLINFKITISAR